VGRRAQDLDFPSVPILDQPENPAAEPLLPQRYLFVASCDFTHGEIFIRVHENTIKNHLQAFRGRWKSVAPAHSAPPWPSEHSPLPRRHAALIHDDRITNFATTRVDEFKVFTLPVHTKFIP
jgi:hypothetical protein